MIPARRRPRHRLLAWVCLGLAPGMAACASLSGLTQGEADGGGQDGPKSDASESHDTGSDHAVASRDAHEHSDTGIDASVCSSGQLGCNDQQPQQCIAGHWENSGDSCTMNQTCVDGACAGVCGPDQVNCAGQQPQTCDASGQWQNSGTVCDASHTCLSGACAGVCGPGQVGCTGQQPQSCGSDGQWQDTGAACPGTEACLNAVCLTCLPNSLGCNGAQPQQCNATGTAWTNVGSACTAGVSACVAGVCSCANGQTQCQGFQTQECSSGVWTDNGGPCTAACNPTTGTCCTPISRYTVLTVGNGQLGSGTGRVLDNMTGLTWLQYPLPSVPWANAAGECNGLGSGWALPTEAQAESIGGSSNDGCAWPWSWDTWVTTSGTWVYSGGPVSDPAGQTYVLCVNP